MVEEIEKYIENFNIIIFEKYKQLRDLKNILKANKNSYWQVTEENKQLKHYTTNVKKTNNSNANNNNNNNSIITGQKNIKRSFMKRPMVVSLRKTNKKQLW